LLIVLCQYCSNCVLQSQLLFLLAICTVKRASQSLLVYWPVSGQLDMQVVLQSRHTSDLSIKLWDWDEREHYSLKMDSAIMRGGSLL